MVVRDIVAVFIDSTAENSMGQWIAGCFDFPAPVDKHLRALGSLNGIKHDGDISAHWVLHTAWDADTTACKTVNLVFYGAGAYSYITEQVREVAVILRVCLLYTSSEYDQWYFSVDSWRDCDKNTSDLDGVTG